MSWEYMTSLMMRMNKFLWPLSVVKKLMITFIMNVRCLLIHKMPETHTTALLNTLWEFTRGVEEDNNSFIQKALKVCKTFKIKSLKTPKPDVPAKKTAYNMFCKVR